MAYTGKVTLKACTAGIHCNRNAEPPRNVDDFDNIISRFNSNNYCMRGRWMISTKEMSGFVCVNYNIQVSPAETYELFDEPYISSSSLSVEMAPSRKACLSSRSAKANSVLEPYLKSSDLLASPVARAKP